MPNGFCENWTRICMFWRTLRRVMLFYANAPCINAILATRAAAVIRIKGDNRKLLREADRLFDADKGTTKPFKAKNRNGDRWIVTASYDAFEMPGVDESLCLVRLFSVI